MNNANSYREIIVPVQQEASRPLWSVMIPTYNCANYLRETLKSVLAQDPGADIMQIEVVDDCSTKDDPKAVVEEVGQGRVSFYRQPENVGHVRNFNTCLQRSRGHLVHLLHGDDGVRKGFYRKLQRGFEERPEIGAAFCRHIHMNEQGHWHYFSPLEQDESGVLSNWLARIAIKQQIQAPSIVVRREVYEKLGGFDRRIRYWGEDWEMWVRIAAQYPVWYEVEPLALYRTHSVSLSGRSVRSGENIQDFRQAIAIVRNYLPDDRAEQLSNKALDNYARYAINTARKFVNSEDSEAALNQIREALKCYASPQVIFSSLKLSTKLLYKATISSLRHSFSSLQRTTP
ncbi:MAG: hypothetical protein Kow00121_23570 [Elainellaceae cyanobacterium]